MTKVGNVLVLAASLGAVLVAPQTGKCDDVREVFANPPESTRLQMYYHWIGDGVTREGLVRDFKAMGELGVGVAHIVSPAMAHLPVTAKTMSPEWLDLFAFAIGEAHKNGVKLSFHNCPGWSSSGGPWIPPELSMKVVVASETDVRAGETKASLAQPLTVRDFYRDIAVFAIPLEQPVFRAVKEPVVVAIRKDGAEQAFVFKSEGPLKPTQAVMTLSEVSFHADCTVEASSDGQKWKRVGNAAFRFHRGSAAPKTVGLRDVPPDARYFRVTFRHAPPLPWVPARDLHLQSLEFNSIPMIPSVEAYNTATKAYGFHPELERLGGGIAAERIVDLTSSLSPDGTVDLGGLPRSGDYRIVRIGYTSTGMGPAPSTIAGLECDKLDKKGIEAHWRGMPAKILALPGAKETVVATYIDSYEVGGQNWSECLADEYLRRNGAAIGKDLLSVCGYLVGDGARASRFLWDFQRTIGELMAENYFGRFAELCQENGIRSVFQSYGGPFEPLRCARTVGEPQGEFWMSGETCGNSVRIMASAAHLHGRRITSAESFTTESAEGRWLVSPHWLRTIGDRYGWLDGCNSFVFHSYCHQPFTNVVPGLSLGRHGSQFNVNTTWWKDAGAWRDYVRRGQALLQFGRPRAEVLVVGREAPSGLLAAGFNHDLCGAGDLMTLEARPDGVGQPGLPSYQMIVVTPFERPRLTPESQAKLKALADAGVRVDYGNAADAVRTQGLRPPFSAPGGALRAIRREGEGDETIWFVVNVTTNAFAGEATCLAKAGTRPEFFDAKTGKITPTAFVPVGADRFSVKLALPPEGSAFVVFTKDASAVAERATVKRAPTDVSRGWTISSFSGLNPPKAPLVLDRLADWSQSDDLKLRYFSGRAVYEKTVDVEEGLENVTLDLGEVREIANVSVNGRFVACLWERPYQVELPREARGKVRLRVEVVNLLPNRLIGDAIARRDGVREEKSGAWPQWVIENKPDSGTGIFTWSNYQEAWSATDRPLPSGLLGPVLLY